jgi:hypothetical protein
VAVVLLAVTAVVIVAVVLVAVVLASSVALAADPSMAPAATPLGLLEGGDPRSEGGGPGLSGSPLLVLLGVVALGMVTVLVTIVLARVSQRH